MIPPEEAIGSATGIPSDLSVFPGVVFVPEVGESGVEAISGCKAPEDELSEEISIKSSFSILSQKKKPFSVIRTIVS